MNRIAIIDFGMVGRLAEDRRDQMIRLLLGVVRQEPARQQKPAERVLSNIQRMKLIEETIEREIRPALRTDGGDIDLLDIQGTKVLVTLRGACTACPSSGFTLKGLVQSKLREFVSDDIEVVVES